MATFRQIQTKIDSLQFIRSIFMWIYLQDELWTLHIPEVLYQNLELDSINHLWRYKRNEYGTTKIISIQFMNAKLASPIGFSKLDHVQCRSSTEIQCWWSRPFDESHQILSIWKWDAKTHYFLTMKSKWNLDLDRLPGKPIIDWQSSKLILLFVQDLLVENLYRNSIWNEGIWNQTMISNPGKYGEDLRPKENSIHSHSIKRHQLLNRKSNKKLSRQSRRYEIKPNIHLASRSRPSSTKRRSVW